MDDTDKMVDHPAYYNQGKQEVIEFTQLLDFCTGNAVKYILRAPYKGQYIRDLKKARWYMCRLAEVNCGVMITKKIYDMACGYENALLKEVFDCLYFARKAGDSSGEPYKKASEILTRAINEQEFYEVKRELKRCKEELRKANDRSRAEMSRRILGDFPLPWSLEFETLFPPLDKDGNKSWY